MTVRIIALFVVFSFFVGLFAGHIFKAQNSTAAPHSHTRDNVVLEIKTSHYYWDFKQQKLYVEKNSTPTFLYQKGIMYRYQKSCWHKIGKKEISAEDEAILMLPLRRHHYPYMAQETAEGWDLEMHTDDTWKKVGTFRPQPIWPKIILKMC